MARVPQSFRRVNILFLAATAVLFANKNNALSMSMPTHGTSKAGLSTSGGIPKYNPSSKAVFIVKPGTWREDRQTMDFSPFSNHHDGHFPTQVSTKRVQTIKQTRISTTSTTQLGATAMVANDFASTLRMRRYNQALPSVVGRVSVHSILQRLTSTSGMATILSFSWVSALSYCVTLPMAWYLFAAQSGLSPLAAGQWKGFLSVFAGVWISSQLFKPMRFFLGLALRPTFCKILSKVVTAIQNRTAAVDLHGAPSSRFFTAKAVAATFLATHVLGTVLLMSFGIYTASAAAGVPVFPR